MSLKSFPLKMLAAALVLSAVLVTGCGKNSSAASDTVSLEELNRALSAVSMAGGRLPGSIHELTNFPTLKGRQLPAPPPGKKLVLDPATRQAIFVDQQ